MTGIIAADLVNYIDHRQAVSLLELALDLGEFTRSVSNCHTAGLDSIVLFDGTAQQQGMVRFFWAKNGAHKLVNLYDKQGHFTLGVHNHRYPIAIVPLVGPMFNVRTELTTKGKTTLHEYGFASALADEDTQAISTVYKASRHATAPWLDDLSPGDVCVMDATELHTVLVPDEHSQGTAWMVIEGAPVGHESLIYSPREDLTITSKDLYLPLSVDRARGITEKVLDLAVKG